MMLSEIKIKEIKSGLEVISVNGTPGKVTKCAEEDDNKNKEIQDRVRYDTVFILTNVKPRRSRRGCKFAKPGFGINK